MALDGRTHLSVPVMRCRCSLGSGSGGKSARGPSCRLHRCCCTESLKGVLRVERDLPGVRPSPSTLQPPRFTRVRRRLVQPAAAGPCPGPRVFPAESFAPAAIQLRDRRGSSPSWKPCWGFLWMVLDYSWWLGSMAGGARDCSAF